MNRKQRRAAEHQARKQARKAGFPIPSPTPTVTQAAVLTDIPEPGGPLPSLADITPPVELPSTNRATPEPPTVSSQTGARQPPARHNGHFAILHTEDGEDFDALKRELAEEHQPSTVTERILINAMAESLWLSDRAQHLLCAASELGCGEVTDPRAFNLYLRYHSTHFRAFHKSLSTLLKLRAERRKAENGFEAQKRKEEEIRIKTEKHEMQKQKHYWDVLLKDAQTCHQLAANSTQTGKAAAEDPGFKAQFASELANRGLKNHSFGVATAA